MDAPAPAEWIDAVGKLAQHIRDGFDVHGHCEICRRHEGHEDWCPWPPVSQLWVRADVLARHPEMVT